MSDTHRKVKLNARVTPAKKEEWKNKLDEDETMSSLVRRAVDKEINGEYVPQEAIEDFSGGPSQSDIDLSPILEQLAELQRSVTSVEQQVNNFSATQADDNEDKNIEELAMDLLPRLPNYPNDIPEHALKDMGGMGGKDPREYVSDLVVATRKDPQLSIDGSTQRFSHELQEPAYIIRESLCYLENDTTETVHSAIVDGTRHWMRF